VDLLNLSIVNNRYVTNYAHLGKDLVPVERARVESAFRHLDLTGAVVVPNRGVPIPIMYLMERAIIASVDSENVFITEELNNSGKVLLAVPRNDFLGWYRRGIPNTTIVTATLEFWSLALTPMLFDGPCIGRGTLMQSWCGLEKITSQSL
jgi:hypothetical protein